MPPHPAGDQVVGTYERLGRYELLGEIAAGGMATVYLGRALGAKGFVRMVAIKRLHPHLQREEEFVAMFLDEARLAAKIRHPNVVPTLDVDDREGLYIVMEYVEGDRLLGLLRHAAKTNQRTPVPIALRILVETLSGLEAAHNLVDDDGQQLNLVHRDISPQNVLVGIDGITKITDFGIAKAESRLAQTREGQLKGKIAYMAPEQTRRVSIDRRVDIFATGILAWELFTSRRLFRGDTDVEVLNAVVNEPIPSPKIVAPEIPPVLEAAIMKALQREPEQRWLSAGEFADALEKASSVVGGLASTRTVAQFIQQVAGPKLEQERARLKAGLTVRGTMERPSSTSSSIRDWSHVGLRSGGGTGAAASAASAAVSAPASNASGIDAGSRPTPDAPIAIEEDLSAVSGELRGEAVSTRRRAVPFLLGAAVVAVCGAIWLGVTLRNAMPSTRSSGTDPSTHHVSAAPATVDVGAGPRVMVAPAIAASSGTSPAAPTAGPDGGPNLGHTTTRSAASASARTRDPVRPRPVPRGSGHHQSSGHSTTSSGPSHAPVESTFDPIANNPYRR